MFYIPAHRTLSVAEGWPAGFRSYKPDTPFVVRDFSERLLELLTTKRGAEDDQVFPRKGRLKEEFRELIDEAVFHGGKLTLLSDGPRRQVKLVYPHAEIAYMAWSAGQREFIPLLLGINHLVPLGKQPRVHDLEWIVIEEPEMGLHAKAIQAVMLLILELVNRGYRVVLSTHSTAVVEIVWALQVLKARGAKPAAVTKVFDLECGALGLRAGDGISSSSGWRCIPQRPRRSISSFGRRHGPQGSSRAGAAHASASGTGYARSNPGSSSPEPVPPSAAVIASRG
jgi:hypothetical protein